MEKGEKECEGEKKKKKRKEKRNISPHCDTRIL